MERFVCGIGRETLQPEPALLEALGVAIPERLHFDPETIAAVARRSAVEGWVRLPFCNTLSSEGLGGRPALTLEGARIQEPPYARPEELPLEFRPDSPRMEAMFAAMDTLAAEGAPILYQLEGPFTLLSSLIPMARMYAALRKPAGAELLARAEDWAAQYAGLAAAHGARVFSFADPVATLDLLGERMFRTVYRDCCVRVLTRLGRENPGRLVHLCGKMTQSLLDTGACRAVRWDPDVPCKTYGQALARYQALSGGAPAVVGHFCLNLLGARRPYLTLLEFNV